MIRIELDNIKDRHDELKEAVNINEISKSRTQDIIEANNILERRMRLGLNYCDDEYKAFTYTDSKQYRKDIQIANMCIFNNKVVPHDVEQRLIREKNYRDKIMEENNKSSQHR